MIQSRFHGQILGMYSVPLTAHRIILFGVADVIIFLLGANCVGRGESFRG